MLSSKHKHIEHLNTPGHAHLLTFSCHGSRDLLVPEERKRILGAAVSTALAKQDYHLFAWVFMPNHVHLLVRSANEAYDISELLYAIKRPSSFRMKSTMSGAEVESLTVEERPGKHVFRFWQEGPGHDRNVFDNHVMQNSIDYIHDNPVRRGFVAEPMDWAWSSAREHAGLSVVEGAPRIWSNS